MKESKLKIEPKKDGEISFKIIYLYDDFKFYVVLYSINEYEAVLKFKELYSENCKIKEVKNV